MLLTRILLALCLGAAVANAADRVPKIDLDNGVAITGNGRAAFTNPAALTDFHGTLVDVAGYNNAGGIGVLGHLSSNLVENIAIGVGMDHTEFQTTVVPGIGASTGKLSFGVSTTIVPGSYGLEDFIVGFRWDKSEDFSFGIVAYDVPHLKTFAAGLGIARSQKWMGDVDVVMNFQGSNYDLASAEARIALSYKPASKVWMMARLYLPVVPDIHFDTRNIELGLHVWMTSKTAVYVLAQTPRSDIAVGVKLKI